jgi:hypothetical protein
LLGSVDPPVTHKTIYEVVHLCKGYTKESAKDSKAVPGREIIGSLTNTGLDEISIPVGLEYIAKGVFKCIRGMGTSFLCVGLCTVLNKDAIVNIKIVGGGECGGERAKTLFFKLLERVSRTEIIDAELRDN